MFQTAPTREVSDPDEAYGSPLRVAREKHEFVMNSNASPVDKIIASADYFFKLSVVGIKKAAELIKVGAEIATPHVKEAMEKLPKPTEEDVVETFNKMNIPKNVQSMLLCQESCDFHQSESRIEIEDSPRKGEAADQEREEDLEQYMKDKANRKRQAAASATTAQPSAAPVSHQQPMLNTQVDLSQVRRQPQQAQYQQEQEQHYQEDDYQQQQQQQQHGVPQLTVQPAVAAGGNYDGQYHQLHEPQFGGVEQYQQQEDDYQGGQY